MREGDPLHIVSRKVTQDDIVKYAEVSHDFNPIHVDEVYAEATQFGSTIAHGMMIAASISEIMTLAFKDEWLNSGRLKIRFRSPVFPGDIVTTSGRVKSVKEDNIGKETTCTVEVRRQNGIIAIAGTASVYNCSGD